MANKQQSFCVPLEELEPAAIRKLRKVHPEALAISVEWRMSSGDSAGSAVVWWVEGPNKQEAPHA